MINWKVRIANKNFWLSLIPALLLFVQVVANLLGLTVEVSAVSEKLIAVINALFVVLAILGIVNDPTTAGLHDSNRAMGYSVPNKDK